MIKDLVHKADTSLDQADRHKSRAAHWRIIDMYGLTSQRIKHLVNNLCGGKGVNYLEVGAHKGATLASALYDNNLVSATIIENFCYSPIDIPSYKPEGWPNVKIAFEKSVSDWDANKVCHLIEKRYQDVLPDEIKFKPNVIFYDVPLEKDNSVAEFLNKLYSTFDKEFILVVGDFNRQGQLVDITLRKLKTKVHFKKVKDTGSASSDTWWGGVGIYVVEKV